MKKTILSIILIAAVVFAIVWLLDQPKQDNLTNQEIENTSELTVSVIREGSGDAVLAPGVVAVVHYEGFLADGTLFDSSIARNIPFEFPYGEGQVIPGWEMGREGMKVVEQRQIMIPPQFAYGSQEVGPIPANSTLVFNVELLEIK